MSFEPSFLELMNAVVTYKPLASRDGWGKPAFSSSQILTNIPAKITYRTTSTRSDRQEDTTSTATIIIPPPGYEIDNNSTVPTVATGDHFILPDGTERRVLSITSPFDESGLPHHQSIALT